AVAVAQVVAEEVEDQGPWFHRHLQMCNMLLTIVSYMAQDSTTRHHSPSLNPLQETPWQRPSSSSPAPGTAAGPGGGSPPTCAPPATASSRPTCRASPTATTRAATASPTSATSSSTSSSGTTCTTSPSSATAGAATRSPTPRPGWPPGCAGSSTGA